MLSAVVGDVVRERSRDGEDVGDDVVAFGVVAVPFAPGSFAALDVAVALA
jgi:hypothetical protein